MGGNGYEQTYDFKLLLQSTDYAVIILDSDNLNAIDCNKPALQLFGYDSISEISTDTFAKLIETSKLPETFNNKNFVMDIKTSVAFKKKYSSELPCKTKEGESFFGELNISKVVDARFSVYICIIHDITVKKTSNIIQQFVYNMSLKDYLSEQEMAKMLLEKALEITSSEFAVFAYVDKENDQFDLVQNLNKRGLKRELPIELNTTKLSSIGKDLMNLINKNRPDKVNNLLQDGAQSSVGSINNIIYIPIVINNNTKCFLAAFDKKLNFTTRDLELTTQLMQNAWMVLQRKKMVMDTTKTKINLERVLGNTQNIEKELIDNKDRFEKLIANMTDEVWMFDKSGKILGVNDTACRDTKYSKEELLKRKFYDVCPNFGSSEFADFFELICKEGTLQFEGKLRRKDASEYDFEMFAYAMDLQNKPYVLCYAKNLTEQKKLSEALQKSESKYRTVVDQALEMIIICKIDGAIIEVNELTCQSMAYTQSELLELNVRDLMTSRTVSFLNEIVDESVMKKSFELTERVLRKDGSRIVGSIRVKIIEIDSEKHIMFTIRDVADEMKREERIRFLNFHDKVSGLYNKAFLEEEMKRLDLGINLPMSIIMGDINGLKLINSSYGHAIGDKLINTIAYIMLGCCRSEDIVARWGGDEFVILLPNADEKICESICKTIENVCKEYKDRNADIEDVIDPSISFGYATKHKESQEFKDVMRDAEDFMYKRKMLDKKSMHSSIVHSMRNTLFEKNFDSEEYSSRLNIICRKIGQSLGLPDSELNELELLSILHDVGKIVIDAYVLNKDGNLSEDDWKEVKKHPEVGYRIIKSAPELASVAEYVLAHHERWDGKGYPNGIAGDAIPLKSRIIAVADAYAAMTQDKTYRKAMLVEQAKTELTNNMNTQFDAKIVKTFLEILETEKSL